MAAVIAMLDEEHEMLDCQDRNDNNSYAFGRIHKHNVVIACLPAGIYGTTSAAIVAKDMLRTFNSLKFGLMIGIGGGIPGKIDIRLGDVVVSNPTNTSGGVIQHDGGKLKDGEEDIELKGSLNTPPTVLLNALTQLKAQRLRKPSLVPMYLKNMIKNNPLMEDNGYSFPGIEHDQLFDSAYSHEPDKDDCGQCDKTQVLTRQPRKSLEPRIHYGIIASGNQVFKDAKRRDKLASKLGALCVEMEAAGLMNNFPCIVIRGICDYADSHKNKEWQPYAASTAAAFAKELLSFISPGRVRNEDAFRGTVEELKKIESEQLDEQKQHFKQQKLQYDSEKHRNCHIAFKPTVSYESQKDINPLRNPGTCQWAFEHPKFKQWHHNKKNDLLWISADPGCGKSVLSRSFVDKHLGTPDDTVCYFFFKDNDDQDRLSIGLCAILHQLFGRQRRLIQYAMGAWEKHGKTIQQETAELWRLLLSASTHSDSNIVCVFDALDECRDDDQKLFISFLSAFYKMSCSTASKRQHLKILVTSRPYADIEFGFKDIPPTLPAIRLSGEKENDSIRQEISLVLLERIQRLGQDFDLASDTVSKLQVKLLAMEHRTYLWLHLALGGIKQIYQNSLQPDKDSEALELLPSNVEDAYEKILQRVQTQDHEKVRVIFQIIVGSKRPMTVTELALAFTIASQPNINQCKDLTMDENRFEKIVPQLCGLFVFINHSKVYLIHQTAKEFLQKPDRVAIDKPNSWIGYENFKVCDTLLASICTRYLLFDDLVSTIMPKKRKRVRTADTKPSHELLGYTAEHWPEHFRESDSNENLVRDASLLYDTSQKHFHIWFDIFWQVIMREFSPLEEFYDEPPQIARISVAAYNGHTSILKSLNDKEILEPTRTGREQVSTIIFAATSGKIDMVKLLIETGADVNAQGGRHGNALQAASIHDHESIVQLLIKKGANVNAQKGHYGNALQAASHGGHESIVQLLIEKGADVNAQGGLYSNALQAASDSGHESIVQLLIEKGANVNAQGGRYGNALQTASIHNHKSIVQLLIEKGANINAQGGHYRNALQAAISGGHESIVQLLIEKGANFNAQGGDFGNALQAASHGGHESIVQLLINKGANVNAQGGPYGNALQAASSGGHESIVQLLIEKGANINAQGGHYGNALQAASNRGHESIVQLLIKKGADINAQGGHYGNALQAASSSGHESIVQLLIEKGANVNAQGGEFGNALQAASFGGYESIIQLLINKGANINAQGGDFGNALQAASNGGYESIIQLLIEKGANVNAQGGPYGNALQAVSSGGHESIVQLLIKKGADVNAQGGLYGNALQAALVGGHESIVQLLIEKGAYVNTQG
ncbi:Pfs, NACHT and ankyrin protein [Coleophoma crateriformis]|uniref:Pfs, NACHT and ankyrin protein n=1 Tax=Coleophoma crateriformis TaxID=565419 RepID=A0A3D8Q7S9_9HELO|nr:Pfs, NACHT and ankyrin protein [Coleophoma crateriformis]